MWEELFVSKPELLALGVSPCLFIMPSKSMHGNDANGSGSCHCSGLAHKYDSLDSNLGVGLGIIGIRRRGVKDKEAESRIIRL